VLITGVAAETRASEPGLDGTAVVIGRSNATGVPDSAPARHPWSQMRSHRWARTSLRRAVASSTTVPIWDAVTSFNTAQWSASSAGARWRNYLLRVNSERVVWVRSQPTPWADQLACCGSPLPQHVTLGRQSLIAGHFLSFPYSTCRKVSLNRSENLAAVPGDTASLARVP
jgi:hypothetical protein